MLETVEPTTPIRPPAPTGVAWIDVAAAARRMGVSDRRVRQLCAQRWLAVGQARQETRDGARVWLILESADSKLSRVKFADDLTLDLRQFTAAHRRQITRKKTILDQWSVYRKEAIRTKTIEAAAQGFVELLAQRGESIGARTLRDWEAGYRDKGLAGLVDGRRDRGREVTAADPFFDELKVQLQHKRGLAIKKIHRMVCHTAAERGWPYHSYHACRRFIATIPPAVLTKWRKGEEAYVNQCEPYIERDYTTLASNESWCSDHHQMDVLVDAGGGKLVRPWLTAWQDMRSRKIVGWRMFAHDPNTDTILASFRDAVLEHGVPQGVYVDNGKDFDSYALNGRTKADRWEKRSVRVELDPDRAAGVFPMLNVAVTHAWPYHGQSKPIERFFGTLEGETPVWPTYCGRSTAHKPEDLQLQIERGKAPKLDDFVAWFADWLASHNATASAASGLDGKSPDRVFAENLHSKRTASAELLDAACLRRTPPVKVGRNGVTYGGLRYGQYAPELFALVGGEVVLAIDDTNRGNVQVWSVAGKFICLAKANAQVPFNATAQELRDAIKQKKQHRKTVASFYESRPRMHADLPELMLEARAAANAAAAAASSNEPPRPPPNIQPVRTAIEGELSKLQRAIEAERPLRKAAGAEGMSGGDAFRRLGDALDAEEIADPFAILAGRSDWQANRDDTPEGDPFDQLAKTFSGRFSYEPATDAASQIQETQEAYRPFHYERPERDDELEQTP